VTLTGGSSVIETFVINVAVTLTVNTRKGFTDQCYAERNQALLNIAPRNVFDAWSWR